MTGDELRAARERLGARPADLAARAGVSPEAVAGWEASAVPRAAAYKLDRALWELERDQALAQSGLAPCQWVTRFAALPDGPRKDLWILEQHIGACEACQARGRFIDKHVRPRPQNPWLAWAPPLPRAMLMGAGLTLIVSGGVAAVAILLFLGLVQQDANLIVGAGGVLAVCIASGAAGGAVHYLTRRLRSAGTAAYYVSWVLAVEAALGLALALIALAAWQGLAGLGADELRVIVNPVVLLALATIGVLVAAAVGARLTR